MIAFVLVWLPLSFVIGSCIAYVITHRFLSAAWHRTALTFAGAILLTLLCFVSGIGVFGWIAYSYPRQPFSSAQWALHPATRYTLIESLRTSTLLYKLSKTQTIALLGKPDVGLNTDAWTYELGYEPGFLTLSPSVLTIYFENNRVISQELIQP